MLDLLQKHIDLIVTGVSTGLLTWIFERGRKKAEVRQVESDAIASMQRAYNTFVEDMNLKYADVKSELILVRKELEEYKIENRKLKEEIQLLINGVNVTSNIGKGKRNKK